MLSIIVALFNYTLHPLVAGVTILDLIAAFRLCFFIRQQRQPISFLHGLSATLMIVYGGEAMTAPLLGIPPSFIVSGVFPCLYAVTQIIVDALPNSVVPMPSIKMELPLSIVDGFTRAFLLCSLIPPAVTANASPVLSTSPWALLVTSLVTANGGFFLTNLFSLLRPTFALTTPPELLPYGWTSTDLWCAPLITGLYALLTHAQPFWTDAHVAFVEFFPAVQGKDGVEAMDPEAARAVCAVVLAALFVNRTVKAFSERELPMKEGKTKTQ